jgi:hypothetical protein
MPLATVITILNIVNALFGVIKELPGVQTEINSLLEKIAPHVNAAGPSPQAAFIAAKQRLVSWGSKLVNPATGIAFDG